MINRDNYEEFFLMYVDGELSTTEKEMVDAFVQQNPDLKDELAMLQQAVLLPEENLVFTNKNLLFKHVGNQITTTNYEEKFLLYIDNELTPNNKAEVETFVLQHPQLQNDFTLLKQTKLQAEAIVCPNKEALYKTEKERRVVYMRWFKIAAAAIVIGLIAMVYFLVPNNTKTQQSSFANNTTVTKNSATITPKVNVPTKLQNAPIKNNAIVTTNYNKNTPQNKVVITNAVVKSVPTEAATKQGYKPDAIEYLHDATKKSDKNDAIAVTNNLPERTINSSKNSIIDEPTKAATITNNLNINNTTAQQVVYKELNTNDEQKSLLVGSIEINKDKLRGFLRKASKLFGNKQKNDDEAATKSSLAADK